MYEDVEVVFINDYNILIGEHIESANDGPFNQ